MYFKDFLADCIDSIAAINIFVKRYTGDSRGIRDNYFHRNIWFFFWVDNEGRGSNVFISGVIFPSDDGGGSGGVL